MRIELTDPEGRELLWWDVPEAVGPYVRARLACIRGACAGGHGAAEDCVRPEPSPEPNPGEYGIRVDPDGRLHRAAPDGRLYTLDGDRLYTGDESGRVS